MLQQSDRYCLLARTLIPGEAAWIWCLQHCCTAALQGVCRLRTAVGYLVHVRQGIPRLPAGREASRLDGCWSCPRQCRACGWLGLRGWQNHHRRRGLLCCSCCSCRPLCIFLNCVTNALGHGPGIWLHLPVWSTAEVPASGELRALEHIVGGDQHMLANALGSPT